MREYTAQMKHNDKRVQFTLDDLSEFTIVIWNDEPVMGPAVVAVELIPSIEGSLEHALLQIPYGNTVGEITPGDALWIVADWFSKNTCYRNMSDPTHWGLSIGEIVARDTVHNNWIDFRHLNGVVSHMETLK